MEEIKGMEQLSSKQKKWASLSHHGTCMILWPTPLEPVKATLLMPGWRAMACHEGASRGHANLATRGAEAREHVNDAGGEACLDDQLSDLQLAWSDGVGTMRAVRGVFSDDFMTTVQPVASAGPSFQA